jgi:Ser-tRNA(Ala) deacylase AlaX
MMRTKVVMLSCSRNASLHRDWDRSYRRMAVRSANRLLRHAARRELRVIGDVFTINVRV